MKTCRIIIAYVFRDRRSGRPSETNLVRTAVNLVGARTASTWMVSEILYWNSLVGSEKEYKQALRYPLWTYTLVDSFVQRKSGTNRTRIL